MEKMDGGSRAWITVFGVFCNYFLMFGFLRSFSALIEPIKLHYSTNYLAVNTVPGAICIGFMLMCLFGGPILQKFGVRRLAWIFGPIPCLSYLGVYAFSHFSNFWLLMIPYFTLSIAFGMIYLYCIASLKAHFSKKLTLATQLGTMGTPTGQLAIPSILTALIDKYSYANGMLIWAGINLNALAASILLLPNENNKNVEVNPKGDHDFSPDGNEVANLVGTNVEGDSVSSSSKSGPKSLFCTVTYWLYVMQQVCVNVGYSSGVIYVVSFSINTLNVSQYQGAMLLSIQGGVDMLTRVPWGILADHKKINRHYLYSFVCLNMAIAILALCFVREYSQMIYACVYMGLFSGIWGGLAVTALDDITKTLDCEADYMNGLGLSSAAIAIFTLCGSVTFGALTDKYNSYIPTYVLGSIIMFGSSILSLAVNFTSSLEASRNV